LVKPDFSKWFRIVHLDHIAHLRLPYQLAALSRHSSLYQPPTLIVWGKNDKIFPAEGAHPYKRDLPDAEFHLIDTGHFALEDKADEMVPLIRDFLSRKVARK
jgi:pimeloyl-ACP methyl ester carboxylesterase